MITFKTMRWKNFLSTGDNWSTLDFQKANTTLVVGHNGAGKSTMLDALSFGLFGKAHRSISKTQLVNSINKKATIVEVVFEVFNIEYKVVRGIKPNVFEIWKGGDLIDQSSHAKEYQKILEQNILKLNHKSFHQIVVLGSSSFVPFMQLTSQNRRDVIEDLLDINVFSKMNGILKEKAAVLKDQLKDADHDLAISNTKIESQSKYISSIKALNEGAKEEKLKLIEDFRTEIATAQAENLELSSNVEAVLSEATDTLAKKETKKAELFKFKNKFEADIRSLVKNTQFFESNDICPTCTQPISKETKKQKIKDAKKEASEFKKSLQSAEAAIDKCDTAIDSLRKSLEECRDWEQTIHTNNRSIDQFQSAINRTQQEIDNIGKTTDLDKAIQDRVDMKDAYQDLVEQKLIFSEQQTYNVVMAQMLKDTGIKTKIVKQFLPIINKLCNEYLQILDFFVHFNLDEAFVETIRSRHRDNFSYASFSEGEKQRIDLALLFTWRQIAKMKNSVATNLLILDETFDSSLDHEGVDNLMKIIYTLGEGTNVFVISHKGELLDGKFAAKIEISKEKNFSKIKEVNNGTI